MNFRIIKVYLLLSILICQPAYSIGWNTAKTALLNFITSNRTALLIGTVLTGAGIATWLYLCWRHSGSQNPVPAPQIPTPAVLQVPVYGPQEFRQPLVQWLNNWQGPERDTNIEFVDSQQDIRSANIPAIAQHSPVMIHVNCYGTRWWEEAKTRLTNINNALETNANSPTQILIISPRFMSEAAAIDEKMSRTQDLPNYLANQLIAKVPIIIPSAISSEITTLNPVFYTKIINAIRNQNEH